MAPVPEPTAAPFKANVDPLGAVSGFFGFFGNAVASTGSAIGGFVVNPFNIFGDGAVNKPKDNMWTCFTNMIGQTEKVINTVGQMISSCSVTVESDLKILGSGLLDVGKNLNANVVQRWFTTGCDPKLGMNHCLGTVSPCLAMVRTRY